jgi:hypothetical protein
MAILAPAAPFLTSPTIAATFNPMLWSKKLNAKYYVDNQLTEITNTNWEGEIKNQGDTVRIRTAPTLTISDYVIGGNLQYEVPTPIYQDMLIEKAKSFAFQCNDVQEAQADMNLLNMYMEDAAKQLKISITEEVFFSLFCTTAGNTAGTDPYTLSTTAACTRGCAAANQGATAGTKSASLDLGTDASPLDVTASAALLLTTILRMAAVLDEQNVPESGRFLIMSPVDRQIMMNTDLAQAYFTGDNSSIVRTGKIGMIDRFTLYVSNMLPRAAATKGWVIGSAATSTGTADSGGTSEARRCVVAGHKDAMSFASQISKTEQVRNPSDFGDFVRGLAVYGRKVVKPEAFTFAVVQ